MHFVSEKDDNQVLVAIRNVGLHWWAAMGLLMGSDSGLISDNYGLWMRLLKKARAKAQRRKNAREKDLEIDEIDVVFVFSVQPRNIPMTSVLMLASSYQLPASETYGI